MKDKNGTEIKKGDIVKIEGAYFKKDNGIYLVNKAPGDKNWLGDNYCLYKMNKNNINKKAINFWPLQVFVLSWEKRIDANDYNREHATIEIIGKDEPNIDRDFAETAIEKIKKEKKEMTVYQDLQSENDYFGGFINGIVSAGIAMGLIRDKYKAICYFRNYDYEKDW